jgi:hypothetical protein
MRLLAYKRFVEQLPVVSKMHPHLVIEDTFHRMSPREYLFEASADYFDAVSFVWIDSDESYVKARLEHMAKEGLVESVGGAMRQRRRAAAAFEAPPDGTSVFTCVRADNAEADALLALARASITK